MCPRAKTSWIKAFRLHIRDAAFFEAFNLAGEPSEVLLKADDRLAQLLAEIEARGVLAPEGDQVAAKTHVVADKDFEACQICRAMVLLFPVRRPNAATPSPVSP